VKFDHPATYHTTDDSNSDVNMQIYRTAVGLFEDEDYEAAAATARLVSSEDLLLNLEASKLIAVCDYKSGNYDLAIDEMQQGLQLIATFENPDAPELRMFKLAFLSFLAEIYLDQGNDELAWRMLHEAQPFAEIEDAANQDPLFRKGSLGMIHHNLAILYERSHQWSLAANHYGLAYQIWQEFPDCEQRCKACHAGYMTCGENALRQMYQGLD
jgi:tetratricopeptide (TPR) repeat protein